jgi:hypothetical protein
VTAAEGVIPADLSERDQWVLWRYEARAGNRTKVPYQPNGRPASVTTPSTWRSHAEICQAFRDNERVFTGIGYVFDQNDPFAGIDLDNSLAAGDLKAWAKPIVESFYDTYIEVSPSGNGLKIFAQGKLSGGGKRKNLGDYAIEIYDRARFFTVTGQAFRGAPLQIEAHQPEIEKLYEFISERSRSNGSAATEGKIPRGQRHNALVSMAGAMRRRGMSVGAIDAALWVENCARCEPAYDRKHVREIAESAGKWQPEADNSNAGFAEWPEIIPIRRIDPDPIPSKSLPGWLGETAEAISEATETPVDLAALLSIAVASSCVAGKALVSPESGYSEPLNVYVCPAMESGNRKTAVLNFLLTPLIEQEGLETQRIEPERKRLLSERQTMQCRIDKLRKNAASADDPLAIVREIVQLENSLPEAPAIPRLFCEDITPERLASMMQEQGEKMAVFSDEGGIFDLLAGRYSNGVPNLDLWLKAHAVSPVRVDRQDRTRLPILMNRPHLVVGISPQPDVLAGLRDKPGFRGRGLLARWLYALPQSRLGRRMLVPKPVSPEVQNRYANGIRTLAEYQPASVVYLKLSPASYLVWKNFQRSLEPEFLDGGTLQDLKDSGESSQAQPSALPAYSI